jgi:Icc-related predicted phosphoesterase
MNITCISDTHNLHEKCKLNGGEILIHGGDFSEFGSEEEIEDFMKWFAKQPFNYKICIAGNHDILLENASKTKLKKMIPSNVIYLNNNGITIDGIKIWGSPVTPYFLGLAFNQHRGDEIKKTWQKIPKDTDILITHGPPFGILDAGIGCEDLLDKVQLIKPKLHIFGHAHEQNGMLEQNGTTFINAALVNQADIWSEINYKLVAKPITFQFVK